MFHKNIICSEIPVYRIITIKIPEYQNNLNKKIIDIRFLKTKDILSNKEKCNMKSSCLWLSLLILLKETSHKFQSPLYGLPLVTMAAFSS